MYQYYYTHWGLHLQVIIYFAALLQTDLSAELALRSQYQCCFHKITKSAYYTMKSIHKKCLILSSQEFARNVNHS